MFASEAACMSTKLKDTDSDPIENWLMLMKQYA